MGDISVQAAIQGEEFCWAKTFQHLVLVAVSWGKR